MTRYAKHLDTCRSCGKPMLWTISVKTGKRMPVDPDPNPEEGKFWVLPHPPSGLLFSIAAGEHAAPSKFTSHFATCPDAREWSGTQREEKQHDEHHD